MPSEETGYLQKSRLMTLHSSGSARIVEGNLYFRVSLIVISYYYLPHFVLKSEHLDE